MGTRTTVLSLLMLLPLASSASVVHLRGGGRLEGRIVSSGPGELVLETAQGRVRIGRDRVERIEETAAPVPAPSYSPSPPPRPFRPRRSSITFDLGFDVPLDDVTLNGPGGGSVRNGSAGLLAGARYLTDVSPRFDAGVEVQYAGRGVNASSGLLSRADTEVSGGSTVLLGLLKWSPVEGASPSPYFLAGAGAHRTRTTIDATPVPGFVWSDTGTPEPRRLVDGAAWGFAATLRAGLDFAVSEPAVLSLEGGWTALSSVSYGATPQGRALGLTGASGPLDLFTLAMRFGWRF